jgi:hypothetical protein
LRPLISEGLQPLRRMGTFTGRVDNEVGEQSLSSCSNADDPIPVRRCDQAVCENAAPELDPRYLANPGPECRLETRARHAKPGKAAREAHEAAPFIESQDIASTVHGYRPRSEPLVRNTREELFDHLLPCCEENVSMAVLGAPSPMPFPGGYVPIQNRY